MQLYKIPVTVTFHGQQYLDNIELLLSDRQLPTYNEDYQATDLVTVESCLERLYSRLNFNINFFTNHNVNWSQYYNSLTLEDKEFVNKFSRFISTIKEWEYSTSLLNNFTDYNIDGYPVSVAGSTPLSGQLAASINQNTDLNIGRTTFRFGFTVYSQHAIDHGEIDDTLMVYKYVFIITVQRHQTFGLVVTHVELTKNDSYDSNYVLTSLKRISEEIGELPASVINLSDPFDTGSPADLGGGDGFYDEADVIEKMDFPDLPEIDALTSGLITVYNPSVSQIQALGNYLWSNLFDINSFKKLFSDPIEAIIGLGIVPVKPVLAGTKSVHFGDVDTGVVMPYIASQFVEVDLGSVEVKKYVGSFMDYDYTSLQIYLPYIGIRNLDVHDCMGCTLTLKYHIDVLTGGCAAMIYVSGKGVLYQFNGSCIANVPLTSNNYSTAIQNAISAVISGGATIAGAISGAAPLTAVGIAGLASSAANTAISAKSPSIERSGSLGGAAGLMALQQPYIIIERPNFSIPKNLSKYTGNMLNVTLKLGNVIGFTQVDYIHLDGIPCTDNERSELLSLLKEGVIF